MLRYTLELLPRFTIFFLYWFGDFVPWCCLFCFGVLCLTVKCVAFLALNSWSLFQGQAVGWKACITTLAWNCHSVQTQNLEVRYWDFLQIKKPSQERASTLQLCNGAPKYWVLNNKHNASMPQNHATVIYKVLLT